MQKEFNLSEKIFTLSNLKLGKKDKLFKNFDVMGGAKFIEPKDIKEFIKRLKELINKYLEQRILEYVDGEKRTDLTLNDILPYPKG